MQKLLIAFIFTLLVPVETGAETSENAYLVDSIFDLKEVEDVEIDTRRERLLVTMKDTVLYLDLFPLSVVKSMPLSIQAGSGSMSARGNLFLVGERDSNRASRGPVGALQVFKAFGDTSSDRPDVNLPLDTTPISESFFNGSGEFFAVGPTRFSVLYISEQSFLEGIARKTVLIKDLKLSCGTSAHFSVFNHEGRLFYVSSVNGNKAIEYGPIDPDGVYFRDVDCFNPNRLLASKSKLSSARTEFSPVQHALVNGRAFVQDDDFIETGLLTFDVDERSLSFFPLEYFDDEMSIVRSESVRMRLDEQLGPQVRGSDFGLLASSDDGRAILLSYFGSNFVHRLTWRGAGFEYQGRFDMGRPVKKLYITPGAEFAVIVTAAQSRGGREELTLIKSPAEVPAFDALRAERFSVTALQRELEQSGAEDLALDGIFGNQTQKAMQDYLARRAAAEATRTVSNSAQTPTATSNVGVLGLEDGLINAIRGLFPLRTEN